MLLLPATATAAALLQPPRPGAPGAAGVAAQLHLAAGCDQVQPFSVQSDSPRCAHDASGAQLPLPALAGEAPLEAARPVEDAAAGDDSDYDFDGGCWPDEPAQDGEEEVLLAAAGSGAQRGAHERALVDQAADSAAGACSLALSASHPVRYAPC